jgi:hypothetical protein
MEVSIRPLAPDRWPEAGRLAGRAFWTEDYMAPLADDQLERFAIVQDLYLGMEISPTSTTLGAFAGEHLAGFACVERGACFFCTLDPDVRPAAGDRTAEVMHGVDLAIRALHSGCPGTRTSGRSRSSRPCRAGVSVGRWSTPPSPWPPATVPRRCRWTATHACRPSTSATASPRWPVWRTRGASISSGCGAIPRGMRSAEAPDTGAVGDNRWA